jgi:hypothetical protein
MVEWICNRSVHLSKFVLVLWCVFVNQLHHILGWVKTLYLWWAAKETNEIASSWGINKILYLIRGFRKVETVETGDSIGTCSYLRVPSFWFMMVPWKNPTIVAPLLSPALLPISVAHLWGGNWLHLLKPGVVTGYLLLIYYIYILSRYIYIYIYPTIYLTLSDSICLSACLSA